MSTGQQKNLRQEQTGRVEILLSLGANLGNREQTIARAIELLLARGIEDILSSSFYETAPVGFLEQPPFINAAVYGTTTLEAEELFQVCKHIERELGRQPRPRWHERELDIDIILYGEAVVRSSLLTIPHPQMHERRFVLEPAAEIAPTMRHPILRKTIVQLYHDLKQQDTLS